MTPAYQKLHCTSPLPEGWSEPEILCDTIVADGITLHRAGLSCTAPGGEELTGSAVESTTSPLGRGYFELLERVSTFEALREKRSSYELLTAEGDPLGRRAAEELFPESDAPSRWRYARSNGVALHADWSGAARRALWELVERDRVLRSWYGKIRPRRLEFSAAEAGLGLARSYRWLAYSFPETEDGTEFSRDTHVAGVFGFPRGAGAPFVCGYGARDDSPSALDAAVRETLQLLGFLWGEPPPERLPDPAPTPMGHLERLQWPGQQELVRRWLEGAHMPYGAAAGDHGTRSRPQGPGASDIAFVDLTPSWLGSGLRVAKAICQAAAPLAFGDAPFASHLPPELRVHPIA